MRVEGMRDVKVVANEGLQPVSFQIGAVRLIARYSDVCASVV
jgi:hypothetical protein